VVQVCLSKKRDPVSKTTRAKRVGDVAEAVQQDLNTTKMGARGRENEQTNNRNI
jgi:hypothetical protein